MVRYSAGYKYWWQRLGLYIYVTAMYETCSSAAGWRNQQAERWLAKETLFWRIKQNAFSKCVSQWSMLSADVVFQWSLNCDYCLRETGITRSFRYAEGLDELSDDLAFECSENSTNEGRCLLGNFYTDLKKVS